MPEFHSKNYNTVHDAMNDSIRRLGILQTNLDNVESIGYKGINPDSVLFAEVVQDMFRDKSMGELMETGRPLDMALTSPNAFFLVEGKDGPERTRVGDFRLNEKGKIVDYTGKELVVLDIDPEKDIKLATSNDIYISPKGHIQVNGEFYGRVAIDYDHRKPGEYAYITQGKLESSNVDTNTTFMNMVQIKRHIDTLQNAMAMEMIVDKALVETYGRNV